MIFYLFGILIYAVPGLWVNYTLNKNDDALPNMPFTAKEFGLNLLKEQDLDNVKIDGPSITVEHQIILSTMIMHPNIHQGINMYNNPHLVIDRAFHEDTVSYTHLTLPTNREV